MSFDVPGLEQVDQPVAAGEILSPEKSTARAVPELDATISGSAREQMELYNEVIPPLPDHVQQYLTAHCDEAQLPFALHEAAQLDPADLNDPDIAELLLPECIKAAEIAALDQREQQLDTENAALNNEERNVNVENADKREELDQINTTSAVLSNGNDQLGEQEKQLSAEISKMYTEEAARGGGVDALIGRVSERLKSMPPGTAKQTAVQKMAQVRATLGQMRSVVTNPQERAAFESILSTANLNLGGGNSSTVFADVITRVEASEEISDETKTRLRGITGGLATGSDVYQALDAVDPETGEPVFVAGKGLQVRKGVTAHVEPDGTRRARVEVDGVGVREIPWNRNERGVDIGLKCSQAKLWALNEASGSTDFMGETVHIETSVTHQTDPERLRRTQMLMSALFGGGAGYDGEIISNEDADYAVWFNQFTAIKGDAAIGDYDRDTALGNRTDLGFHTGGDPAALDFEVIRAASLFAKDQYGSGNPDYYALQRHLHDLFPKRVPLTGENEPAEPAS